MGTRGGGGFAAQHSGRWGIGAEHGEAREGPQSHVRWALRRALYGMDSVASSPSWQTAFLLVLAVAVTTVGGAVMKRTHNDMHNNESHDTSYSVRAPAPRAPERAGAAAPPHAARIGDLTPSRSQESVWLAWVLFVDPASIPYAEGAAPPPRCGHASASARRSAVWRARAHAASVLWGPARAQCGAARIERSRPSAAPGRLQRLGARAHHGSVWRCVQRTREFPATTRRRALGP